jgi:hypothetical protein
MAFLIFWEARQERCEPTKLAVSYNEHVSFWDTDNSCVTSLKVQRHQDLDFNCD